MVATSPGTAIPIPLGSITTSGLSPTYEYTRFFIALVAEITALRTQVAMLQAAAK